MSSGEEVQRGFPPMGDELSGFSGRLPLVPESSHAVLLGMSNLNLPQKMAATAGIESLRAFRADVEDGRTGNEQIFPAGYELTPNRWGLARDIRQEQLQPGDAISVHQTFPTPPIRRFIEDPNKVGAAWNAAFWAAMPTNRNSIPWLNRMSGQLGGVCMTVYANQRDKFGELYDFSHLNALAIGTQAEARAASVLRLLNGGGGQSGYDGYFEAVTKNGRRGIDGLIIDNHWLVSAGSAGEEKIAPLPFLEAAEQAKVPIIGMHASFGRLDAKHKDDAERSYEELEAVLDGPEAIARTLMGDVLRETYEIRQRQQQSGDVQPPRLWHELPRPFVIMEVTAMAVVRYQAERELDPSQASFVSITRDMGQSLNGFFDGLPTAA